MKSSHWMMLSACAALVFFLLANLVTLPEHLSVFAGCLQIGINLFVFVTWLDGYRKSSGRRRYMACAGIMLPPIMISITAYRVLFHAWFF